MNNQQTTDPIESINLEAMANTFDPNPMLPEMTAGIGRERKTMLGRKDTVLIVGLENSSRTAAIAMQLMMTLQDKLPDMPDIIIGDHLVGDIKTNDPSQGLRNAIIDGSLGSTFAMSRSHFDMWSPLESIEPASNAGDPWKRVKSVMPANNGKRKRNPDRWR